MKKRFAGVAVASLLAVGMAAGPASAGEITGNGKDTPIRDGRAASICAFSGLNDTYTGDPDVPDEEGFTKTQSWGQLSKEAKGFLRSEGLSPGDACNPSKGAHG